MKVHVFDTYVTIKDREGHPDMDDTLLEKLDEMLTTYGVPHAFTLPHEKTMEDCPEATLEVAYDSSDDITFTINLSFDLYYQREWSWDDVSAYVTEAINGYFLELAQSWADQNEALVVRISQVESRLLGITGILDIANTKINGEAANCTLTLDHIPVLGTIEPGTIVISG